MEVKWTQSQAEAIESRGRDLLVSAAAGSGKTAVLTARIISRLTDAENPVEISRILAVTFTKAAAAELKERISKALYKTVKADPKNKVLARQILLLNQARISTIHSFCYNVVKNNFHVLGLNANIRIADDMEIQLIYNDVMNRTIEYFYNTPPDEMSSFEKLVETFVTTRDDNLNDTFIKLYKKLKSYPDGLEFIIKNTGDKWVETFCRITERQLNYFKRAYEMALDYMSDEGYIHYRAAFEYDYKFICGLLKNLDYDSMRTLLQSYEKQTLDRRLANNLRTDELNVYKEIRDDFRKMPEKIYNDFFGLSDEQIENAIEKTASINKDIYLFLTEFEKRLNAEKLRRGILDFADLEQLTYNLLYRGGKLTDS
ncbi:MAG: UvrD-helicase domain-containing protein, partial [Oscillospiraceae bacterium]|nr:UvrD-helicase domain-containing protein [Oscillospiraceae bacterium]